MLKMNFSFFIFCVIFLFRIDSFHRSVGLGFSQLSSLRKFHQLAAKGNEETFVCESCGAEHIKWVGRCTSCKEWNTIKAFRRPKLVNKLDPRSVSSGSLKGKWLSPENVNSRIQPLSAISDQQDSYARISLSSSELNRVVGGGLVKGSVVLLVGEPGIGKSTLLLQLAASIGLHNSGNVIYLSGEENPQQIAMRSRRMGLDQNSIYLVCDVSIDHVIDEINSLESKPSLLIVDSIQTMNTENCESNVGTVSQIRESTSRLVQFAKSTQIPVILIGHVTKSGDVAGPKILEHMVDTVLSLEGSEKTDYRIVRCDKNR
jgi:DNA repair protein RadA/Sms